MSKIVNGINHNGIMYTSTASTSNEEYIFKIVDIGDWNMDTTFSLTLTGITENMSTTEVLSIINMNAIIRNDNDNQYLPVRIVSGDAGFPTDKFDVGISSIDEQSGIWRVILFNKSGGTFDNSAFNSTSYNRGWISFNYKPD